VKDNAEYFLLLTEIEEIIYQSGEPLVYSQSIEKNEEKVTLKTPENQFVKEDVPDVEPAVSKDDFYKLRDNLMLDLMAKYDEDGRFYKKFSEGISVRKHGRSLIKSGTIISAIGLGTVIFAESDYSEELIFAGFLLVVAGETLITVGIPISIVSGVKRNKAKDAFYDKYLSGKQSTYTPTLQLKLVPNGVGLALNF
jgi:hypothetical protein